MVRCSPEVAKTTPIQIVSVFLHRQSYGLAFIKGLRLGLKVKPTTFQKTYPKVFPNQLPSNGNSRRSCTYHTKVTLHNGAGFKSSKINEHSENPILSFFLKEDCQGTYLNFRSSKEPTVYENGPTILKV